MSTGRLGDTIPVSAARERLNEAETAEDFRRTILELSAMEVTDDSDPAELAHRYGRRFGSNG